MIAFPPIEVEPADATVPAEAIEMVAELLLAAVDGEGSNGKDST